MATPPTFFPDRPRRPALADVVAAFPFPLALTYARLHAAMDRLEPFPAWRNEVFGHGVFQQDLAWYARQALDWLARLHDFYDALRPALAGWRLVARTAGGETVDWHGCDFAPLLPRHEHDPAGHA